VFLRPSELSRLVVSLDFIHQRRANAGAWMFEIGSPCMLPIQHNGSSRSGAAHSMTTRHSHRCCYCRWSRSCMLSAAWRFKILMGRGPPCAPELFTD